MQFTERRKTRALFVGNVQIGGGAPITVQSMTNTPSEDVEKTLAQIRALASAGCDIARLAIPHMKAADALPDIVKGSPIPLVADIHFNHQLALRTIDAGIAAVRINPGNIGSERKVQEVAEAAGNRGIPIRVGVNAGSLPKGLLEKHLATEKSPKNALAKALCEAAVSEVKQLERCHFENIAVSLKASSVPVTVAAYRLFAELNDYPLHVGVTEAGTSYRGLVKSSAGIGALLLDGIGDTIRVSLTADPCEEIRAGIALLEALEIRDACPEIVSCPSCARTAYNLFEMVDQVEKIVAEYKSRKIRLDVKKIAVMGCVVNGPGEAKDADFGFAGAGDGRVMLIQRGQAIATLPVDEALAELKKYLDGHIIA